MKTIFKALLSVIAAVFVGYIAFSSLKTMFGFDSDIIVSNAYSNRMAVSKQVFIERSEEYQTTAVSLLDYEDIKIFRSPEGAPVVLWEDKLSKPEELFDAETVSAINTIFEESELPAKYETEDGSTITDVRLFNIAVSDGDVLFYMYYGDVGTVAIAYDASGLLLPENGAITIIDEWEIYSMENDI